MTFKHLLIGAGVIACGALVALYSTTYEKPYLLGKDQVQLVCAYEEGSSPQIADSLWLDLKAEWGKLTNHRIALHTPNISELHNLGWLPTRNYSTSDIKRIAHSLPASETSIKLIFLNGYYTKKDKILLRVSGISLKNEPVIALFTPAIKRYAQRYDLTMNQTILHEIGHVIGLVNLSIPQHRSHQKHDAHCRNSECIMHWNVAVPDTSAAQSIFCNDCIEDVKRALATY